MSWRAGMGGFALLAVLAAQAGEPAAPLADSKKELKALQQGAPAPGSPGAVENLRGAMPQLHMPDSDARPLDPLAAEKAERELKKKKATEKNWLVNGMEQLDKNNKSTSRDAVIVPVETKDENGQPAAGDPGYLLKIYSEQEKNAGAKNGAGQAGAVRNDPLKPFLQGWLADSPSRGKLFDEPVRKTGAAVGYGGPSAAAPSDNGGGPILNGIDLGASGPKGERGSPVVAQPNPYLQGLDMSVLQDSNPGRTSGAAAVSAFQPAPTPAAGPISGVAPAARPADKKRPPSALEDDKKYFPQVKKF